MKLLNLKKTVLFLVFPLICSCVYGPKLKNKTSYLNGRNYKGRAALLATETKKRKSLISGNVVYNSKFAFDPKRILKISLLNNTGQVIDEYTLSKEGKFIFNSLLPDGDYELIVSNRNKTVKTKVIKLSGYEKEGIKILL